MQYYNISTDKYIIELEIKILMMMRERVFSKTVLLNTAIENAFAWHERPGAFERLTPPWERVEVAGRSGGIKSGDIVVLKTRVCFLSLQWTIEHEAYQPPCQFQDRQLKGPFSAWLHTHRFTAKASTQCELQDYIEFRLPFGLLGHLFGSAFVDNKLEKLFVYRHCITQNDMDLQERYKGVLPMKILVTGASGMVGSALIPLLTSQGHTVSKLVRKLPKDSSEIRWDPDTKTMDIAALEGFDAVIHLAGENIASGRWTSEKKDRIRKSRVEGTRLLSESLASLSRPPKVMVCASAVGYYGSRGDDTLDETTAAMSGDFLSDVCRAWEAAAAPAQEKGIRVVNMRFGMILSPKGGALSKILPPFQMGAGGRLGSGKQFMSWVAIDDVIGAIYHALMTDTLFGPVNTVAPNPVRNSRFTKILGKVLWRPTLIPVPSIALSLLLGEMADALLLASQNVYPNRLLVSGYQFRYPELEGALRHVLGR